MLYAWQRREETRGEVRRSYRRLSNLPRPQAAADRSPEANGRATRRNVFAMKQDEGERRMFFSVAAALLFLESEPRDPQMLCGR
ncbi:Hypothetical protein SMAX5B_016401 [Scophthalmus maximus]|uniref:Uncharacterized protein n=1 Tax=Scophthalmus maximus TaxID=52904 RepID=A0A2U9C1L6_SCOMX|nr:Hypothetical protein SMAX5B_016401 [Scophthalmus maximus]